MEQILMQVKGMTCEGCSKGIVAALRFVPGVETVDAQFETGRVQVSYDPAQVTPEMLRSGIEALDYDVVR